MSSPISQLEERIAIHERRCNRVEPEITPKLAEWLRHGDTQFAPKKRMRT